MQDTSQSAKDGHAEEFDRQKLPISKCREEIVEKIKQHQFVIVKGEPSSGKSTQVPQYLLQAGYKNILSVQPRRAKAVTMAHRVAQEMHCEVGGKVGFKIRHDSNISDETTIEFVTEGTALKDLSRQLAATKYSVVIVDEIHERSIEYDILLGLLKMIASQSRPDLRVVIMSAWIDVDKFVNYLPGCVSVNVPGHLHPVQVIYPDPSSQADLKGTLQNILKSNKRGDVLVFLPSVKSIDETVTCLSQDIPSTLAIVMPYHSDLAKDEREAAMKSIHSDRRKIICATSAAEGLTFSHVVFVIDCGLEQISKRRDLVSHEEPSVDTRVTKQQAERRKSVASRIKAGVCYRLYSQKQYEEMRDHPEAEIERVHCAHPILLILSLAIKNLTVQELIDPPAPSAIESALKELSQQQMIDCSGQITDKGLAFITSS